MVRCGPLGLSSCFRGLPLYAQGWLWPPYTDALLQTCPMPLPRQELHGTMGVSSWQNPPANAGDKGSVPGSGRSPGERSGNALQHSCLENPLNRGAWWATVHGVAKDLDTTWWLNNNNSKTSMSLFCLSLLFNLPVIWRCDCLPYWGGGVEWLDSEHRALFNNVIKENYIIVIFLCIRTSLRCSIFGYFHACASL